MAYDEYTMKKSNDFEHQMRFEKGQENLDNDSCCGSLKTQMTHMNVILGSIQRFELH